MRIGPTIEGASIDPIVVSATRVMAHRQGQAIEMADGTDHLTEAQHSQKLPNSIALICAHAQYVIRKQSAGGAPSHQCGARR